MLGLTRFIGVCGLAGTQRAPKSTLTRHPVGVAQPMSLFRHVVGVAVLGLVLAACAPVATSSQTLPSTTSAPSATQASPDVSETTAPGTAPVPNVPANVTPQLEPHTAELEWPPTMRLGDSASVRFSLVPSAEGYTLTTGTSGSQVLTQTLVVRRLAGYDVEAVAELSGVAFDIAPAQPVSVPLPLGEPATWRWTVKPRTPGTHLLTIDVRLRWVPLAEANRAPRTAQIWSRPMRLEVITLAGLSTGWVWLVGFGGVAVGALLSGWAIGRWPWRRIRFNRHLHLETPAGLSLTPPETRLLQTVFAAYTRALIATEFRSGYSGARTLLAVPVRADGRADAPAILKLGPRADIVREYHNYITFVQHTLPPITARLEGAPAEHGALAAVRYTFVGQAGRVPISLRAALQATPDPRWLQRLFDTFGPQWWQQSESRVVGWAEALDAWLPAHWVLEPATGPAVFDVHPQLTPADLPALPVGARVRVARFAQVEARPDGCSFTLTGETQPGHAPVRVRWLAATPPQPGVARLVGTRHILLHQPAAQADLGAWPHPLAALEGFLQHTRPLRYATIHGDLNLENVLVGPGDLVWLIDFARTGPGPVARDLAHLTVELLAHIYAPQMEPRALAAAWLAGGLPLVETVRAYAQRWLGDPAELDGAVYVGCLGALKYANLNAAQKHALFVVAAAALSRLC